MKRKKMTKPEQAYAWWLKKEEQDGRILAWYFERLTLHLSAGRGGHAARKIKYTPDFLVIEKGGLMRCVEIKGEYVREDSVIKFKMAAELFPYFEWQMIQIENGIAKILRHIDRDTQFAAPPGAPLEFDKGGIPGKGDD